MRSMSNSRKTGDSSPSGSTMKLSEVCTATEYVATKKITNTVRVSFCDDSLLRPLSSWTEHSRLVVHHCRNSSVLSLFSALLALFQCECVSYTTLVQFFSTHDIHQKDRKEEKIKTDDTTFFLDVF